MNLLALALGALLAIAISGKFFMWLATRKQEMQQQLLENAESATTVDDKNVKRTPLSAETGNNNWEYYRAKFERESGLKLAAHNLPKDNESVETQEAGLLSFLHSPNAQSAQAGKRTTPHNYIVKHWKGELSLPTIYWINTFIGNIIAYIFIFSIASYFQETLNPFFILFSLISIYCLLFVIMVWQITGAWRSAQNRKERTGKKDWAIAAQVMCILAIVQSIKPFSDGSGQIFEVAKIATKTDKASHYTIQIKNNVNLHISGYITFDLARSFESILKDNPKILFVSLNSFFWGGAHRAITFYCKENNIKKSDNCGGSGVL